MIEHLEKAVTVGGVFVMAIVSRALENQLTDVVLICAALSATVGVWRLLLSPILKKIDKRVEVAESQQHTLKRLEVLESFVIKLNDESNSKPDR